MEQETNKVHAAAVGDFALNDEPEPGNSEVTSTYCYTIHCHIPPIKSQNTTDGSLLRGNRYEIVRLK
jgi:hypothetical protein